MKIEAAVMDSAAVELPQLLPALPGQIVGPLPGQNARSLPGQIIRSLPGQIVLALPEQVTAALPGQIVRPLPGQIRSRVLPRTINLAKPESVVPRVFLSPAR